MNNTEYENFQILYDDADPGDGIDIMLKSVPGKRDIVSRIDVTTPHRAFRVVDSFPAFDSKGNNVSRRFMYLIKRATALALLVLQRQVQRFALTSRK